MRRRLHLWAILVVGVATTVCGEPESATAAPPPPTSVQAAAAAPPHATFVGSATCAECHPQLQQRWQGSHHDLAIQVATAATVLGDFTDATFVQHGVTTTFSRKGDEFWVRTDGPDGALHDYKVTHTFGVTPLQQYLLEFERGRLQALDIAWDCRPAAQGGQRWFALHPNERVGPRDPLHWTAQSLNWNHQCAECHSTNLQKGYDLGNDSYHTTWSEIDVACEACHGPGSAHVAWARSAARDPNDAARGLLVPFNKPGQFAFDPGAVTARRIDGGVANEAEACGRCHSRRTPLIADYEHGKPLLDTHLVSLLQEDLYFADGQIRDEVYVYGSFVQSRMHHAGVTCSDCHDAHSLQLRAPGNALCVRCHQADHFDRVEHHHHAIDGAGASCVACHMPERDYMVVDPRRDHSLRVPRPDLSVKFGTPNACNNCHRDRDAGWAAAAVAGWRKDAGKGELPEHWTAALDAGFRGSPRAQTLLIAAAGNAQWPPIVRGTALSLLAGRDEPEVVAALRTASRDAQPFVRLGVAEAAGSFGPQTRGELLLPLLRDPIRAVRQAAGFGLADVPSGQLAPADDAALANALRDYVAMNRANEDRDWAHVNLGLLAQRQQRPDIAEAAYRQALRIAPGSVRAAVNLADLYREQERDGDGEAILRATRQVAYEQAPLQHSLGLLLARNGQTEQAVELLGEAVREQPDNARFAYTFGVALASTGRVEEGLAELRRAHQRQPYDLDLLFALATLTRDHIGAAQALPWAEQIAQLLPQNARVKALLQELRSGR